MPFCKTFFSAFFSRKILLSGFVFLFIFSAVYIAIPPKKASAQWLVFDAANTVQNTVTAVGTVATHLKEFGLDSIAWQLANKIVAGITASTVNWINSGFNGNPAYVTNPEQFFTNVADQTVIAALNAPTKSDPDGVGAIFNNLCTSFRPQIRLALLKISVRAVGRAGFQ